MARKDTLQGAMVQLCHRTSLAWMEAANSGSDSLIVRAQRLSVVANELACLYEDEAGGRDELLDKHGEAYGLAMDAICEWEWDEIGPQELSSTMLECARAYQKAAECSSSTSITDSFTQANPWFQGFAAKGDAGDTDVGIFSFPFTKTHHLRARESLLI